jgi:foldase protein PrsA
MRRILILPVAAAFLFASVACGGDAADELSDAIAVVGGQTVAKADLDRLLEQSRANSRESRRPFPKPGTPQYVQIRDQLVQFLVRRAQLAQEADEREIEVSNEQVEQRHKELLQQYFGGDDELYAKHLEKTGVSDEQARADIKASMIQEALFKDVAKGVRASEAELRKHYRKNARQYSAPARRSIRQIVLAREQKALAWSVAAQLRAGASFARLARLHSQDPRANAGGRIELSKGRIHALDAVAFSIAAHKISGPVRTRFGWHVIEALGPVRPAGTLPYEQVKGAVREDVLQRKRSVASSAYAQRLARSQDVRYQPGFAPRSTRQGRGS